MGRVRKGRDIDAALCKKGFRREIDGDHIYYFFPGTKIRTKLSHGMKGHTIGPELLALMARQLHLTKSQFLALIDCTLDEEGFREILTMQGLAV